MKKSLVCLLSFLLIIAQILIFTSCEQSEPEADYDEDTIFYTAKFEGNGVYIYDDYVFYYDGYYDKRLEYQHINNICEDGGLYIYSDPLASEDDDPFGSPTDRFFLVDYAATEKNKNSPVLIIAYDYEVFDATGYYSTSYFKIVSYDLAKNEMTVIQDGIDGSIQSLHLYGNYIIYTTNDGDEGYNIYSIKKDGSGYAALENTECYLYRMHTAYNGYIYFYNSAYQLYRAPLDLSEKEYLFDTAPSFIDAFVEDGYLIYSSNYVSAEDNDWGVHSVDICRIPFSDFTAEPEVLVSNVYVGMAFRDKFYYFHSGSKTIDDKFCINYDTLYVFSFDTMSSSVVWEKEDFKGAYMGFSDDYVVYKNSNITGMLYAIDIATGEETEIPY